MQENKPNASKLIDALRQVGYDNYTAIADLVDNSLDAYATLVRVDIGKTKGDDHLITVSDNGEGMNEETLKEAIRLGSEIKKDERSDLGKYGMGLVTASISVGKKLVVVTKQGDRYLTAVHDVEQIKRNGDFVALVRPANDVERNAFIQRVGGSRSGTIVYISSTDLLQNKNLSAFKSTLVRHFAETYREFINAGKKMYVGTTKVEASDPLMLEDERTMVLIDESKEFNGDPIRLKIVALPRLSRPESLSRGIN
ncbi:ATP-binding protein, partial [Candidatus Saccharibacteria bacterium]|nr:ATP-binding protein [Candidatus Saccharibacteria bacterium]